MSISKKFGRLTPTQQVLVTALVDELLGQPLSSDSRSAQTPDETTPQNGEAARLAREWFKRSEQKEKAETEHWAGVANGRTLSSPLNRCPCGRTHSVTGAQLEVLDLLRLHQSLFVPSKPVGLHRMFMGLFDHNFLEACGVPGRDGRLFTLKSNPQEAVARGARKKLPKSFPDDLRKLYAANDLEPVK